MKAPLAYEAVVVGASAGGLYAITQIVAELPDNYRLPVVVVQHRAKDERSLLEEILQGKSKIQVQQAEEKEVINPGKVYIAPPDYHLLVERSKTFSLTNDPKVNFSRPSIDVLFETAAEVYREKLIAILLTGANHDGCRGIEVVNKYKGLTIAQDPNEAEFPVMPKAAIDSGAVSFILTLNDIRDFLLAQGELRT